MTLPLFLSLSVPTSFQRIPFNYHPIMPIRVNPAKATIVWTDFHEVAKIPGPAIARAGYTSSFAPARVPQGCGQEVPPA